ncbi:MAG: ABC transporter substrate-binding protein [Chloroflexota bacterium]
MAFSRKTLTAFSVIVGLAMLLSTVGCAQPTTSPTAAPAAMTPSAAATTTAPSAAPITPAPAKVGEVRVGILLPLTGSVASYAERIKYGFEQAVEEINKAGGIKSLGGAKFNALYFDTTDKPDVAKTEAERVILKENVTAIIGIFGSPLTYPASELADRYKIPWLVQSAVRDDLTDRGFKYLFRACQKSSLDAQVMVNTMALLNKKMGTDYKNVALLLNNTDASQANAANLKTMLPEAGFNIVLEEIYPKEAADLSSQVLKVKSAKPDVLMVMMSTPDAILAQNALADNNVDVKAIISYGDGHSDPAFYKAVGKLGDYIISNNEWDAGLVRVKPQAKALNDAFIAKFGEPMPAHAGQAYSNVYVLADAIERAASIDRDKVRDALAKTNITEGPALVMPYAKIQFDETGQNMYTDEVTTQWADGRTHIVYPEALAEPGYKPVWPQPTWAERLKK